tara:strand:+ start:489 stop:647 length:159 start_codon:yes stop_codon:yes gene_type:complete
MNKRDLERILESVTIMGEALTGLRAQLVNGGFSEEIAEEIILQALRNQQAQP